MASRRTLWLGLAGGLAALLAGLALLLWLGWRQSPPTQAGTVTVLPAKPHLGDPIVIELPLDLPWYRCPSAVSVKVPEGMAELGGFERSLAGLGFGHWRCRVRVTLQAYELGPFAELTATIQLPPERNSGETALVVALPALTMAPRFTGETDARPEAAGTLSSALLRRYVPRPAWVWWTAGGALLALAALIGWGWWYWRQVNSRPPELPKPWAVAGDALFALEQRLPLEADVFFVALTDLVRRYLEAAFALPATERTTPEFLRELQREAGPLTAEQRLMLTDLLTAADRIKFGRGEATQEQMVAALRQARHFVTETALALQARAAAGAGGAR